MAQEHLEIPDGATPVDSAARLQFSFYLRRDPALQAEWELAFKNATRDDWWNRTFITDPAALARLNRPSATDIQKIRDFAAAHGLTAEVDAEAGRLVTFDATLAQVETALGLSAGQLGVHEMHTTQGRRLYHGAVPVPTVLTGVVSSAHIVRPNQLSPKFRPLARKNVLRRVDAGSQRVRRRAKSMARNANQWARFYNATDAKGNVLTPIDPATGKARSMVIYQFGGGTSDKNFAAACKRMRVPVPVQRDHSINGATSQYTADRNSADLEVELDQEDAAGVAAGGEIDRVWAPNTNTDMIRALNATPQIAPTATVSSMSWGDLEMNYTQSDRIAINDAIATMLVAGIPFFNSAGDDGDREGRNVPTPDFPASAPNTTPIGGTFEPGPTAANGEVWNGLATGRGATGCGISQAFPELQELHPFFAANGRQFNECTATGDPDSGTILTFENQLITVGGTSNSSPINAALWNLIQEAVGQKIGKPGLRLGQPRAILISLANDGVFNVIRTGGTEDYSAAGPGQVYSLPAGFGSFVVDKMVDAIATKMTKGAQGPGLAA